MSEPKIYLIREFPFLWIPFRCHLVFLCIFRKLNCVIRDAILPAFSGFPDFSSIQCENEIRFSFY